MVPLDSKTFTESTEQKKKLQTKCSWGVSTLRKKTTTNFCKNPTFVLHYTIALFAAVPCKISVHFGLHLHVLSHTSLAGKLTGTKAVVSLLAFMNKIIVVDLFQQFY